ncbi:acetyltransferase [Arcobacter sp. CECT 8989]|uniref:acyltransferase n=1 Tax=Arcobacter sp. CECT 8989 TaxID=2044509 RepID=UPI00100A7A4F|nr:acyltransferase [Arcobacter sp. CECT 8989]RXK03739.1 acetyltransferase [Arcobacter sp. CECT 8989]
MYKKLLKLFLKKRDITKLKFNRVLPFGEYINDRWEKAKYLGFGDGSSIYDSAIVIGNVKVGENTWIGPNVLLDGSGNLEIGSNCSISAGVQIYSHDSINWAISGGKEKYEYSKTIIEDNCYIAPNVIIQKGIKIGKGSIIGANSFINKNIPANSKAFGTPIKIKGNVIDN